MDWKAFFRRKCLHYLKKLIFTVEAPLAVIADVFRPIHLAGLNHLNGDPVLLRKGERVLKAGLAPG